VPGYQPRSPVCPQLQVGHDWGWARSPGSQQKNCTIVSLDHAALLNVYPLFGGVGSMSRNVLSELKRSGCGDGFTPLAHRTHAFILVGVGEERMLGLCCFLRHFMALWVPFASQGVGHHISRGMTSRKGALPRFHAPIHVPYQYQVEGTIE